MVTSVSEPPVSRSVRVGVVVGRKHGYDDVLTLIRVFCHLGGVGTRWWGRTPRVSCMFLDVDGPGTGTWLWWWSRWGTCQRSFLVGGRGVRCNGGGVITCGCVSVRGTMGDRGREVVRTWGDVTVTTTVTTTVYVCSYLGWWWCDVL